MYIEVLHDSDGNIKSCYCVDTLPVNNAEKLFTLAGGLPAGIEQTRINIDTVTAMEIDQNAGQKAVINPATGQPEIVTVSKADYIMQAFRVDMGQAIAPPAGVTLPQGMSMRGLARKA